MEWLREISGFIGISLWVFIIIQLHKFIKDVKGNFTKKSSEIWRRKLTNLIPLIILASILTFVSISLGYYL